MDEFKFPKSLGACADRLYALREKRLAMQREVDLVEEEEKALKEHLINVLPKSEASGVSGKTANVKIVTKEIPQVKNWPSFYAFVKRNGAFELLGKRLVDSAVKERWEAGEKVPGVESFTAVTVSITKI